MLCPALRTQFCHIDTLQVSETARAIRSRKHSTRSLVESDKLQTVGAVHRESITCLTCASLPLGLALPVSRLAIATPPICPGRNAEKTAVTLSRTALSGPKVAAVRGNGGPSEPRQESQTQPIVAALTAAGDEDEHDGLARGGEGGEQRHLISRQVEVVAVAPLAGGLGIVAQHGDDDVRAAGELHRRLLFAATVDRQSRGSSRSPGRPLLHSRGAAPRPQAPGCSRLRRRRTRPWRAPPSRSSGPRRRWAPRRSRRTGCRSRGAASGRRTRRPRQGCSGRSSARQSASRACPSRPSSPPRS